MKYRTLPNTDVTVSEVGFGLWTTSTGWWGNMTDDAAVGMLHEARDLGITFYDAADTYGDGRSEEQLALAFAQQRDKVVYATKFGYDWENYSGERKGQNEIPQDFSPAFVRKALEGSLRRLKTDYIDVWQMHNARMEQVEDGSLCELLDQFKAEGKIRTWGIALGPAIGWLWEGIVAARRNAPAVQMIWNMLEPFPGDQMVQAAHEAKSDTAFFIRVPHSSGMLEGKYTRDTVFPPSDHRSHRPKSWLINGIQKVETLRFLEEPGRTLGQAAIQWLLAEPRVMSVLPNIYDREQLHEFAAAPDTPVLSREELERVAELAKSNFGVGPEQNRYKGTMTPPPDAQVPVHA
ncbi:MAG TPA: aldo/keto reductase [Candidatus Limnocylindria bacterium]|jgi:aryl-alcohol dehydrogenase-like predicted oxidoreductase|nr:aldo/keto reductase [Candidatus Limnocylindria bacterium]